MAEFLLAMLLLGGGAVVINEQRKKKRNITLPIPEKDFKELKKVLKKSKFFKEKDALKIANIVKKRLNGKKDEQEQQKEIIKNIIESNTVPVSLPRAWCPNDEKTTCSLFDKDQHFPEKCIGDFTKEQCLNRINTFVANENDIKKQLEDYCSRVNDVCVTYEKKHYPTKQDRKICGDLFSDCN